MEGAVFNATLIERRDLNEVLATVKIRPDAGIVPAFEAGQFATLGLPREISEASPLPSGIKARPGVRMVRRAYSIASSPRVRDHLELFVVLVDTGRLTPKLWTLHEGDKLWMDERISGRFTLEAVPPDKDLVMIATGTGIAPFISMIRTYRDENRWRRAVLVNGVRYARDLGYREELEALARLDPRFRYIPIVSREPDWPGLQGHVQQVLKPATYERLIGVPLDPAECHVMLCGNPAMIDSVEALLQNQGFRTHTPDKPGNIHFERYW